mmetsp:Transcript_29823/g.96212  ORF Transcript_29823/g.96212 Transcript_29823/m.96212 type:complete len:592 (-) Transcript_29823:571-2346(-)
MAWYQTHLENSSWRVEGVDSENLVVELFEELAAGVPDVEQISKLLSVCLSMPWNSHLVEAVCEFGFDMASGTFSPDRPDVTALLRKLTTLGMGANPMPFPRPEIESAQILHRQLVSTARGEHTLEHVLVTASGRGYGFVRNLQNCIYGKVRHGIELEDVTIPSPAHRGGLFGAFGSASSSCHKDSWPMSQKGGGRRRWQATGAQVAIKCIERPKYEAHVSRHRGRLNEDPIKEVAVMQHVSRAGGAPHVLSVLGCYADDETVYVVLPFCPHGDLFGLIEQEGGLPEKVAIDYFSQIIQGLETLHELGLAHHDMSLENLMLDDRRQAVIIDFGMAVKTRPTCRSFLTPHRGAPFGRSAHARNVANQTAPDGVEPSDSEMEARQDVPGLCFGRQWPPATTIVLSSYSTSDTMDIADDDNQRNCRAELAIAEGALGICERADGQPLTSPGIAESVPTADRIVDRNYFSVPLKPSRGWPCRCGKLLYMAPELYDPRNSFDVYAVDVWALGIILFLLLTGMPPWDAATGPAASDLRYVYVRDGRLHELLRTWNIRLSEHAPHLLQRLLDADPKSRITIPEVKRHPWWRSLVEVTSS